MRWGILIPIIFLPATSGCSCLVAYSGKRLSKLETKEQVHKKFGKPVAAGIENGHEYEVFRTRREIADETLQAAILPSRLGMSWGVAELWLFPREVFKLIHRTARGQELRFEYDEFGSVVNCQFDGSSSPCSREIVDIQERSNRPEAEADTGQSVPKTTDK